jgi:hypothetical protein
MLRFAAGAGAALLLVLGGFFIWQGAAQRDASIPAPPAAVAEVQDEGEEEYEEAGETRRPRRPPSADARTKEQRRFDRADKDKNGTILLEEMYQPRRRAYAKLDKNGDGRLSFEEWAVRTSTKFTEADRNRDGALTREEFATTAPRRRAPSRNKECSC